VTLPSTHTPEGASNKEVNTHLDKLIVERERPDYDAPWFMRRHWATMWSTMRGWLLHQ
jgi:hypothetical protein